ncbi:hypothetical protein SteCoe_11794 [Stentor coeruleus]|uniref:Uncharacterized protein n=1 Tax=Stentor coeruleus TaxID=5963 RepID=A0A1R2CCD3_9CILI|nr:hypothetical protein SteCoe_11794 [Stentor coeruleus]
MSLIIEDFLTSPDQLSEKSSSIESLTAKLDSVLHSSDEIIVENSGFFKASSNEMTEIGEVGNLPPTDNQSIPKLELEDNSRQKYKSIESYTSLGTVVRHKTPNIGRKKVKILQAPRSSSAKNRSKSLRPREKSNEKELSLCLKNIIKRHPEYSRIIELEKSDLEKSFYAKVKKFRNLAEENIENPIDKNTQKLKLKNRQKDKKREEIRRKMQNEELERLKISSMKYQESCKKKADDFFNTIVKKYKAIKIIEDTKTAKEIEKKHNSQKQIVLDNIKNLCNDKIQMLKEKLYERKLQKLLLNYEQKTIISEAEKLRKTEQKLLHEKNKCYLKKQIEDNILEIQSEKETIYKKIIKKYKASVKSPAKV